MALTSDRNSMSGRKALEKICHAIQEKDPIRNSFLQRLKTFNSINWVAKPIIPPKCAIHGWEVAEEDVLKCLRCNQYLCTKLPSQGDLQAYREACSRLQEKLVTAHSKYCIYSTAKDEQADDFSTIERMSNKELITSLKISMKNTSWRYLFCIPRSEEVKKVFDWLKETQSLSDGDWSNVVLFLCGWSLVKDENHRSLDHLVECEFCNRKWSLEPYLMKKESEGECENTKNIAEPLTQHQEWCAWRNEKHGWESRLDQFLKMVEASNEGASQKHLKRCASFSEDMQKIRKMLKGTP